jgi:hypothetical protein
MVMRISLTIATVDQRLTRFSSRSPGMEVPEEGAAP